MSVQSMRVAALALAVVALVAPQWLTAQRADSVTLRWHLKPGARLNVRTSSSISMDDSAYTRPPTATGVELQLLALVSACGLGSGGCDSVAVMRDESRVGFGTSTHGAVTPSLNLQGDGVVILRVDSLLSLTLLVDGKAGQIRGDAVIDDFIDAIPLRLPTEKVSPGSVWSFSIESERSWRGTRFATTLSARAKVDSVSGDHGASVAYLTVEGTIGTVRSGGAPYSKETFSTTVLWDVVGRQPLSSTTKRHGTVSDRGRTWSINGSTAATVDNVTRSLVP